MKLDKVTALVTGGASGLGKASAKSIISSGGKVAIIDLDEEKGNNLEKEMGDNSVFIKADVSSEDDIIKAIDIAINRLGPINTVVNCAGILKAGKTVGKKGPFKMESFEKVIKVNLIGTFNVIRLAAAKMAENETTEDGERGVIINTASIAAYDGQMGQIAYAASKGGIIGMTLPIARDLASLGIRNVTIAPGVFDTEMMAGVPDEVRETLISQIPFPKRFGIPEEFAEFVLSIIQNKMINGDTIRLDGALRMPAR